MSVPCECGTCEAGNEDGEFAAFFFDVVEFAEIVDVEEEFVDRDFGSTVEGSSFVDREFGGFGW